MIAATEANFGYDGRPPMDSIATVPVLTADEARRVVEDVYAERPRWATHNAGTGHEFHTLGAAIYLSAGERQFERYEPTARTLNTVLIERFGWVHERLRDAVSSVVGAPVRFDDRLARPGFHIFLHHRDHRPENAKAHFDLQYRHVDWTRFGAADIDSPLSMTLALALPRSGGGLLVWTISLGEILGMNDDARAVHMRARRRATMHAYTVGSLAVHSGHQLHRIASTPDPQPGDQRITMQAHAVRVDGTWLMYW